MIKLVSDFKTRLNEALSIRNMKAIELSEKTGITPSTISQYRSGYAEPKDERSAAIADALDVDFMWLKGFNVPMKPAEFASMEQYEQYAETNELTPRNKQFIELFEHAAPIVQESVVNILKSAQPKS